MSKIEYVGRKAYFIGKSLPQICLKLKNFGLGRMFVRERFKKYPEVTYYVLTNIEADMSDKYLRRGIFFANVVFRGAQVGNMEISGFKEDFQLVPKEDEKYYIERTLLLGKYWREPTVVPKFKDLPPLLETILYDEAKTRGLNVKRDELKLPLLVRDNELLSNVKQV